jgi:hypothetical protein
MYQLIFLNAFKQNECNEAGAELIVLIGFAFFFKYIFKTVTVLLQNQLICDYGSVNLKSVLTQKQRST